MIMYQDMTSLELPPVLISAMLPHVIFDGWSDKSLIAAAADLGLDGARARLSFPKGAHDMLDAYIAKADVDMLDALPAATLNSLKIRQRITTCVRTRFEQAAPHREAARRAATLLAMPQNARLAARTLWRTADSIWRACGDTATDYNHYTKRALLSAVYASTLAVWLGDESDNSADTFEFLDRRISGIMNFEKVKARVIKTTETFPRPSLFLGRLRYPAR